MQHRNSNMQMAHIMLTANKHWLGSTHICFKPSIKLQQSVTFLGILFLFLTTLFC